VEDPDEQRDEVKGLIRAPTSDRLVHLMGLIYVSDIFTLDSGPCLSNINGSLPPMEGMDIKPDVIMSMSCSRSIILFMSINPIVGNAMTSFGSEMNIRGRVMMANIWLM
jgi:hypothetical protein